MDAQVAERTVRQIGSSLPEDPAAEGVRTTLDAPATDPATRAQPRLEETARQRGQPDERCASGRRRLALRWARAGFKGIATLVIIFVAIVMALVTWDYYVTAPWTRDGRVRVQVASVAPQVSGQITELRVGDNQYVHKGDVLYVIDPFDFEVALRIDKAQEQEKAADLQVKQMQSERRRRLSDLATTPEEQQIYAGVAVQAKAAFEAAQQQAAQAEINLRRTQVRSPVNGYVTNLLMRIGDFAHQGGVNISVIDTDSYWIDAYFEETKLARVCIGDRVEARLMGYAEPILGHVSSVTRGIGVSDAAAGTQGLPNVDPVFTWVRLAQRVPVRIAIDHVPLGIPLVSGLSATITIKEEAAGAESQSWLNRAIAAVETRLSDVVNGPPARPGCIPATTTERATPESLPADTVKAATPEEITGLLRERRAVGS
ncbi:MAG: HlyD family secretion protein, partial [Methylobacteriaceae bacterium]|nr:HlyD family secretion protein [Methylobacteriaceae bacterium]